MPERTPLSVARIVAAAVRLADESGLPAVTMRRVGRELGVEGMAIYHHLAGKEALYDELGEWVSAQIELPREDRPWREAIREHAISLRAVLTSHPWALSIVDSRRAPGPSTLRRIDAVVGCLRRSGFSLSLTSHAMSLLDAYVYGFALTERNLPFDPTTGASEFAAGVDVEGRDHPHLAALVGELVGDGDYSFSAEFERGLDTLLDALERLRAGADGS